MIVLGICLGIILLLCFPVELRTIMGRAPADDMAEVNMLIYSELSAQQEDTVIYVRNNEYSDSTVGQGVFSTVSYDQNKSQTTVGMTKAKHKIASIPRDSEYSDSTVAEAVSSTVSYDQIENQVTIGLIGTRYKIGPDLMNSEYSDSTVDQTVFSTVSYNQVTVGLIRREYKIAPMAVGGIALVAGLVTVFLVIGFFIYCNRNTEIMYERAGSVDVENHI